MLKNDGFTILEVCVVVAIIGVISAISIPGMISWREDAKLRDSAFNLRSDLELAKLRAIRENTTVPLEFTSSGYTFTAGATVIRRRQLPSGISLNTTFTDDKTEFRGRGIPKDAGVITILAGNGDSITISMSRGGRITSN